MPMSPGGRFGWEEAAKVMVSVSCGHQHFNFTHISNPADIFTKEMRNGANFCQLWDFLRSRASTSSKGFSLLSVSRREPSPSMLHKPRTMFPLLARAFLTLCSRFLYPALVKLFLASLLLANISYPVLLKVFLAGSYEQSYGGC